MLLKRLHLINYIQCSISVFYMHWETKKGGASLFVVFAVLQWSGTNPQYLLYMPVLYWMGLMEDLQILQYWFFLWNRFYFTHPRYFLLILKTSWEKLALPEMNGFHHEANFFFYHAIFFFFKILVVFPQTWHCIEAFLRGSSSVFLSASVSIGSSICFSYPHACPFLIWMWKELITMLVTFF